MGSVLCGSGHWPDGDMLPLGRIGIRAERGNDRMSMFTKDEQYTLMSLFLICRSPLMFGGNLPDNDKFTLNLITNEEALAVLQKSQNNKLLFDEGKKIAWTADDLNSNAKYVALFYTSGQEPIVESKALWRSRLITSRAGNKAQKLPSTLPVRKNYTSLSQTGEMAAIGIMLIGLSQNLRARMDR